MPFDELSTIFNPDVGQLSWQLSHRYATGTVRDGYWYKGSVWDSLQTPDLSPVPMVSRISACMTRADEDLEHRS